MNLLALVAYPYSVIAMLSALERSTTPCQR